MWKLTVEYRHKMNLTILWLSSFSPSACFVHLISSALFPGSSPLRGSPRSPCSYPSLCLSGCLEAVTCLRRLNRTLRPYLTATCCTCVYVHKCVCVKRGLLAVGTMKHVTTQPSHSKQRLDNVFFFYLCGCMETTYTETHTGTVWTCKVQTFSVRMCASVYSTYMCLQLCAWVCGEDISPLAGSHSQQIELKKQLWSSWIQQD